MTKQIASISISGEITLNMHSLNNEGGEGNQIMTRQLTIVDKDGQEHTVNGISGDMFKHIHVGHLINHAKENKLEVCTNCSVGNPNRLSSGEDLGTFFSGKDIKALGDKEIADAIISKCVVDDSHGVLVTSIGKQNRNHARKSVIEFGWTIGIPEKNNTESYIHTKVVADAAGKRGESSNEGQNIFHRPANHGVYAFVCNIDAYRIGFNDIDRNYAIDDPKRIARYKAILQSLLASFLNPQGAMTSSQKPHITDFKGVVTYSEKMIPAPTISPINPEYQSEIQEITKNLNLIEKDSITEKSFNGLGELSAIIKDLLEQEPYKLS
ncbi:DevR family CRISPR-associated autoregulator [Microbacter margulisiae]|uniref:CRISPR-associated protein Cst2 n=1 Tax=Microbacter margulisiae TaxID=1350067 RepID=A0A7W5H162_9PORP|nr:DevR family CRISPR-associated autoregulator [Microbacter margulisiae]MBB3186021.1 CRISPR-associated protein Cst2 [Microbacter margulisiae]